MSDIQKHIFILLWLFLSSSAIHSQISPGKLAEAHKHLEGIRQCFKCHEIGEKVSEEKCLDCHKSLKQRIKNSRGYHSSQEVKKEACINCHSDHHGRNFNMLNLDEDLFNHDLSGYKLEGKHQRINCRDCHTHENIKDQEVLKKKRTFLGLDKRCISCHEDVHNNQLGTDCASCHTQDKFEEAELFNHNNAQFKLLGQHRSIDCRECHESRLAEGRLITQYKGLDFSNCTDCHSDPHDSNLGPNCTQCHSETGFNNLNGRFNHQTTDFTLRGAHKKLDCQTCHDNNYDLKNLFREFNKLKDFSCANCHQDIHENRFGNDCAECHNENSFSVKIDEKTFDHNRTSFELVGQHKVIDCKECHVADLTTPLPHNDCRSCHEDEHEGQFSSFNENKDCKACHSEDGFSPSFFTFEDHAASPFPLKGAHIATPCFACHLREKEKWAFSEIGSECISCHENIHENTLDIKYYPKKNCTNCHNEEAWPNISFDHSLSAFILEGKHLEIKCSDCHKTNQDKEKEGPEFRLAQDCKSCHKDIHRGQFLNESKELACNECHTPVTWKQLLFDHNSANFQLDGAHQGLECSECHYQLTDDIGSFTLYKLETLECKDCH